MQQLDHKIIGIIKIQPALSIVGFEITHKATTPPAGGLSIPR